MTEEEKKYKEVISALKSLPKVKTKSDFEQKLYRKLRNAEPEKASSPAFEKLTRPKEKNWIFNIFRPAFAPAIGLSVVLIVVIIVYINFIPKQDEISQTEQPQKFNEEMVIKDPGSVEKNTLNTREQDSELITQDVTGETYFDERSPLPVGPSTDVESAPSLTKPDEKSVMEQTIERKESDDKIMEKEGKLDGKVDEMKKLEKRTSKKTENSEEETNLKKNIGDEFYESGVKPSMGFAKDRAKDSLKTDSIKSKTGKEDADDNEVMEQKHETQKQAEPIQQEPNKVEQ